MLRLVDSTVQLLPPDKTRERADALSARAHALWGLGRIEDAKAAWRGAIERYEELGDGKSASSLHHRIARLQSRGETAETNGARPTAVAETAEAAEVSS